MASQPWSKILPSQLTQRPWVAYPYSSWCTFSIRMKCATNVLTSRRRRVQRGLALVFHLEEHISIESSCELEDHQKGDVKMWLLLLLLLLFCVVCVCVCWYSLLLPCGRFTELRTHTILTLSAVRFVSSNFFYHLLSRFSYRLMLFLLRISKFNIFFRPLRSGNSRIKQ